MSRWIINSKGGPGRSCFEISVVREDNEHGLVSYGWFGEDKLLITSSGGPCNWPITELVWQGQLELAREVADAKNAMEESAHGQA